MLDKYLEESILNKATILQIILEFQTIDIEQLAQLTEFSEKIIYQHLAELKEEFNDLFYLKVFVISSLRPDYKNQSFHLFSSDLSKFNLSPPFALLLTRRKREFHLLYPKRVHIPCNWLSNT